MKSALTLRAAAIGLLLVLTLPSVVGAAGADKKKPPPPPAIAKLVWLAGNWRMEKNGRLMDEHWMAPAGGVMLGVERTVFKGRGQEHEFLQIREGPGGVLFYVMQVSGQKEAAFQLLSLTDTVVVFENLLQDFPQKITYALQSDSSLLVTMEGPGPDGQAKRIDYPYQRMTKSE